MSDMDIQVSDKGVLILFDQSNKDTEKIIKKLREYGLSFETKRIYCG